MLRLEEFYIIYINSVLTADIIIYNYDYAVA